MSRNLNEISKVRALIRRLEDHVDDLGEAEQKPTEAVNVLRSARRTSTTIVHLGMPTASPAGSDPRDITAAVR